MKLFLAIALAAACTFAMGQDKKSQDAVRRLSAANQRLVSEKAQLERDKAQALQKLGEVEKARADAESELKVERGNGVKARRLGDEKRALEQKLADSQAREADLKGKLGETEAALAAARQEGEQLKRRVGNQKDTIGLWQVKTSACEAKNGELAKLGYELVERYRHKSCADIALDNEPFTGIGRARMENLLEDYKDRLRAQKFDARRDPIKQGSAQ